jgi:predicted nucleic acid-binding protein
VRFVLDASVALRWVLADEAGEASDAVLERVLSVPEQFAVPELFPYEVLAVLLRVHPQPDHAYSSVVVPILQNGLLRYPMTPGIAGRAFRFAALGLTGYDACYAALAEELRGTWLTFDGRAHRRLAAESLSVDLGSGLPVGW